MATTTSVRTMLKVRDDARAAADAVIAKLDVLDGMTADQRLHAHDEEEEIRRQAVKLYRATRAWHVAGIK